MATAAGMPATLLARPRVRRRATYVESRRDAATVAAGGFREPKPLPLGRWPDGPCLIAVRRSPCLRSSLWSGPAYRHLETTGGAHFGRPRGGGTAATAGRSCRGRACEARQSIHGRPAQGPAHRPGRGEHAEQPLLAGGGALVGVAPCALLCRSRAEPAAPGPCAAGRCAFLPVAVPPMSLAVGWVDALRPSAFAVEALTSPSCCWALRLLPFATFAVRAARRRDRAWELLEAGAVAGLVARSAPGWLRITVPLLPCPGRRWASCSPSCSACARSTRSIFTRTGAETLPVQLYNMIHYGFRRPGGGPVLPVDGRPWPFSCS